MTRLVLFLLAAALGLAPQTSVIGCPCTPGGSAVVRSNTNLASPGGSAVVGCNCVPPVNGDYGNPGGSGNRIHAITTGNLTWDQTIDGIKTGANGGQLSGGATAGQTIPYQFASKVVIQEATWYHSNSDAQGVWKVQGSNNGSTWVDIGSTFNLGGAATTVVTALASNQTGYSYYRFLGVSGTTTTARQWEVDFKLAPDPYTPINYFNAGGFGDRTAIITTSQSASCFAVGTTAKLRDGAYTADTYFNTGSNTGHYMQFQFATKRILQGFKLFGDSTYSHGTWKIQASDNGSSWVDLGSSFTLTDYTPNSFLGTETSEPSGNTTAYYYYRITGVTGNRTNSPYLHEFHFRLGTTISTP